MEPCSCTRQLCDPSFPSKRLSLPRPRLPHLGNGGLDRESCCARGVKAHSSWHAAAAKQPVAVLYPLLVIWKGIS